MEDIFNTLVSLNPDLLMAAVLALLFTAEQLFSHTGAFKPRAVHLLSGVLLQAGYFLVNLVLGFVVVKLLGWASAQKIGLFNMVDVPFFIQVVIGLLAVDLTNYWSHRLAHTWELFWRLHRVHHSDTRMDSATVYRFHPLDAVMDNAAYIAVALVFGLQGSVLVLWFILYIPLLALHHADFEMPVWFDRTFGQVLVSPNFHKVHHHQDQEYTDSNYGLILIVWDKLFGTYRRLPLKEIKYGLKEFDRPGRQSFWFLLKSPFVDVKKN